GRDVDRVGRTEARGPIHDCAVFKRVDLAADRLGLNGGHGRECEDERGDERTGGTQRNHAHDRDPQPEYYWAMFPVILPAGGGLNTTFSPTATIQHPETIRDSVFD